MVQFAELFAAMRHEGLRLGWLNWQPEAPRPTTALDELEQGADQGALRAVTVSATGSVAVKPMRGRPVLKDVLREHFSGCRLVLVHGNIDAPLLTPQPAGWQVAGAEVWTTDRLCRALRRPRFPETLSETTHSEPSTASESESSLPPDGTRG